MADDESSDYKKTLEYRKRNFRVLYGGRSREGSSTSSQDRD